MRYRYMPKTNKTVELYYWSKFGKAEQFAGGDVRAYHMIPIMMRISTGLPILVTPDMYLSIDMISKHKSFSKVMMLLILPITIIKAQFQHKMPIRYIYCTTCYSWNNSS